MIYYIWGSSAGAPSGVVQALQQAPLTRMTAEALLRSWPVAVRVWML